MVSRPFRQIHSRARFGLAQGKFLIASRKLLDPNFRETVVLLFEHSDEGSVGLIINRATSVKLSAAVPGFQGRQDNQDPVYEGGPVDRQRVTLLLLTSDEIEGAHQVFDGVYLSASQELLRRLADGTEQPEAFRVYSGYAGWGPGQLEGEMKRGSWHVLPAKSDAVFDSEPHTVWMKLIEQTNLRWAGLPSSLIGIRAMWPRAPGQWNVAEILWA